MHASKRYLKIAAFMAWTAAWLMPPDAGTAVSAFQTALFVSAIILFALASFGIKPDHFPRLPSGAFQNLENFQEWKQYAENNEEYSKVVWWAFNLPPDQFLHFVQLIVELRYTADQEGLKSVAQYFRSKQK